jgi:hypothetical protein
LTRADSSWLRDAAAGVAPRLIITPFRRPASRRDDELTEPSPIVINLVLRDRPARLIQNPDSGLFSFAWDRSSEWGLNVIRTIWLGFTFLIVLAGVGSFRFAFGNFDAANASSISRPEMNYIVVARTAQAAATNSDPLPAPFLVPPAAIADEGKFENIKAEAVADRDENIWPDLPLSQTLPSLVATGSPGPDWHEPSATDARQTSTVEPSLAKPAESRQRKASESRQKPVQKSNRKSSRKDAVVNRDQEAVEPKACQAEEFEAFRWAFKLPTGCWS